MRLLIDCYNLLHATMPPALAGLEEAGLCRLLAAGRFEEAVVVCDGVAKPNAPAVSPVEGVQLIYPGPGRSADEWIVERVRTDTAARRITVVTDDRAVQKAVRARRARITPCREMVQLLLELAGQGPRGSAALLDDSDMAKHQGLDEPEVRWWLAEFGVEESPASPAPLRKRSR